MDIEVEDGLAALEDEARRLCDEYWDRWKRENSGSEKGDYGRIGPRVTVASGKVYVRWDKYRGKRKGGKIYSDSISPTKRGFTKGCFRAARAWELKLILEFEEQFKKLRLLINAFWDLRKCEQKAGELYSDYFKSVNDEVDEKDESFWKV